jgi:glycosyltransferase involved in cell wall biosynthesis
MRVLHLISSLGCYGAENVLLTLARESLLAGCEVRIGVFLNQQDPHLEVADRAKELGIPVEVFPCRGRWDWRAVRAIRRTLDLLAPVVLHTHNYKSDLYGLCAGRGRRVALVATCHTGTDRQEPTRALRFYHWIDQWILRRFHRVVGVSPAIFESLGGQKNTSGRIALIQNAIRTDSFENAAPASLTFEAGPGPVIGMVTRLQRDKGIFVMLEGARRLAAVRPDARFLFVGDGPGRKELETAIEAAGLRDRTLVAGQRSDMPALYAAMYALTLPSYREGLPMTVLEAMAAGKPVIASRVGAIPLVVEDGVSGRLAAPGDPAELAAVLAEVLSDPAQAGRMGRAGQERVRRDYSARAMAGRYRKTYEEALAAAGLAGERMD